MIYFPPPNDHSLIHLFFLYTFRALTLLHYPFPNPPLLYRKYSFAIITIALLKYLIIVAVSITITIIIITETTIINTVMIIIIVHVVIVIIITIIIIIIDLNIINIIFSSKFNH